MKDFIAESEFHGPFFYGLSIVKKNGPKASVRYALDRTELNLVYCFIVLIVTN